MKSVMMKMIALAIMVGVVISVFAACTPQKPGTESSNGTVEQTQSTTVPTTVETNNTEPSETEPPTTEPPTTEPPTTEPPTTEPPATEPPATETQPPQNDIGKQMVADEFAITVVKIKTTDGTYTVVFTLTYSGEGSHALNAKERIFVVNSDRRSVSVDDIFDSDGNSLLGTSINQGETITIKAVFSLADGFVPNVFRYVYDTMGFRRIQAQIKS